MARPAMVPIRWDNIPRGTSTFLPFTLTRTNETTGEETPYDLTGKVAFFTCKKTQYDDDPTDSSAAEGSNSKLFKITVDCDDLTPGSAGPATADAGDKGFTNSYHGMYGEDPTNGKIIFRMGKEHTNQEPGTYYWDIRIMNKSVWEIGEELENPVYLYAFGTLEIQGTPTNRASHHNWAGI